ncbi:MAG: hypothetical protein M5R36_18680 [Deltaproteobacteria bacterium]|nr:hypothetical protein [Deltaproteobacteria bacterium]
MQGAEILIARDDEIDDGATPRRDGDGRLFRLLGKHADLVHGALDVGKNAIGIGSEHQFDGDHTQALDRDRGDALHAVEALHGFLDREDDPLLHVGGRGAGIGDLNIDDVHVEFGKDLLLGPEKPQQAPDDDDEHQQVRRDGIARGPGDGSFGGIAAVHAPLS